MEIEKNNNKELVPLEHYLEEYAKADPAEISRRTGMPYDAEKHQFTVHFWTQLRGGISGIYRTAAE